MLCICRYDKNRDFQETVPGLALSIAEALQTGIVNDSAESLPYNECESTDEIGNYLCDAIDIALESRRVAGIMNSQAASNEANFNVPNPE